MLAEMTPSDLELLQRFARDRAQDAFTELVQRHLNLVYSAAFRQVRSPQLAEEVAQSVFADLARVAATLSSPFGKGGSDASSPANLTAWLYTVTRHTAVDVIRKESRRQVREQIAYEMKITNAPDANWPQIEPLLDEAVAELDDTDRAAVLLRFFENKSLREVGQQLGVSDDAAQKRVSRAVERLREFFAKRGVTVGAGGLVVVISANAVQAAPVGLAVTISAAAIAGTAATTTTVIAATKTIAMTALQKTLVTATAVFVAAAGTGIFEARQAAQLRDQVQTLQQQQAPLAEQVRQLQNERDSMTNQLAGLLAENARLRSNPNQAELLKLRGEVGTLRRQLVDANSGKGQIQQPLLATAGEYLKRAEHHSEKREYEAQLDDLNHAIELDPSLAKAYRERGDLYAANLPEERGGVNQAIADYTRYLELKPNDGPARISRAVFYELTHQYDKAIADLTTYIEGDTDYSNEGGSKTKSIADAHLMRGRIYQEGMKDYSNAIADYTTAIQMYPKYENVYRMRGECYEAIGENGKAQQDFAIEPKRN